MLKRTRILASLLALVVLGGGCRTGDSAAPTENRQEEIPMRITTELRGGLTVKVPARTVKTKVVVIRNAGEQVQDLFGVQPAEPMIQGDVAVMPGLAVTPFKGKGTYTVEPGSPLDAVKDGKPTGKQQSSVRVEWWPTGGEPQEYLRRVKPCTIEIEDDDGNAGRLRCPDITHYGDGGPNFSLDFRWEKA